MATEEMDLSKGSVEEEMLVIVMLHAKRESIAQGQMMAEEILSIAAFMT